jgi:hypothetical protein
MFSTSTIAQDRRSGSLGFKRGILRLCGVAAICVMTLKKRTFNPKRRICTREEFDLLQRALPELVKNVRYGGNPEHKRNAGDFGLTPPSNPRPGKTLCDEVQIFSRAQALRLLRQGLSRGMVSSQIRNGWPQNVWAVTERGEPLEAQRENDGIYHGYPMPASDPFREEVLKRWHDA